MTDGNGKAPPGSVRVANEVIAHIASLTALQVQGVAGMYQAGTDRTDRRLRPQNAHRGVRVETIDGALHIDIFIVVEQGSHVPTVAATVQQDVIDAVDKMLGLELGEVNVFVGDVSFAEPTTASSS